MTDQTATDTSDELQDLVDAPVGAEIREEELQQIKKKSVTGVMSFFVRTAFLQGIGLASAFILSAFFSPEDFGIYGIVTQIIGLMIFFSDIGLAAALIQKKEQPTTTEYRTAFTVQQLLSWLIVGVALIIMATGAVERKTGPVGNWVFLSLAISFPLATLKTIPSLQLERRLDFSKLVVPQIFEQIVFHGLLIYLAWKGMGVIAYAYAIIARSIIGVVVMTAIEPWKFGLALSRQALKTLLGFGAKFQLIDFLARIKDQLFFLALGWFLPLKEFGYIQWAKNWSQYPYNLTVQNVLSITFPTYSRLQGHKQALKKAIEKSIFFITLAIFPILVGMSLFIKPLTIIIPSYAKWQPALPSFILFTLSIGWAALSTPLVNTLTAIGQINKTLLLMFLWTALTWILTPIGIIWFGFNGVAIAAFAIAFTSIIPVYMVKKVVPIRAWENLWRQLLGAGVMAGVGLSLGQFISRGLSSLLIGIVVTGLAYLVVVGGVGFKKLVAEVRSLRNSVKG